MPDERDLFDDDSLLPDWMRDTGGGDEPSPEDTGEQDAPWSQAASPAEPRSENAAPPPWETMSGGAPPTYTPSRAPAPWDLHPPDEGIGPTGLKDEPSASDAGAEDEGTTGDEIPRGFTAMLPWREGEPESSPAEPEPSPAQRAGLPDEQFTMAGLLAELDQEPPSAQKAPSLADRLRKLSPKGEQPPARPMSEQEADWMSTFGQAAGPGGAVPSGAEDDTEWLRGEAREEATAGDEEEFDDDEAPLGEDDELPWLADDLGEPAALRAMRAEEEERSAAPAESIPDWLSGPSMEEEPAAPPEAAPESTRPADETLPEWLSQQGEPKRKTGIRRIVEPEQQTQPPAGMTYEEWEQVQIDREREASKTPEERLLEQVPEWFDQIDRSKPPAEAEPPPAGPQAPEFVPGWFLGLEDKAPDDAPDWVRKMDYSADALSTPFGEQEPPADQPPTEADIPDWFKGAAAPEVEGVDWDAMFVAPPAAPEPTPGGYFARAPQEPPPSPDWPDESAREPAAEQPSEFGREPEAEWSGEFAHEPEAEGPGKPGPAAAEEFDLDQLARELASEWQDEPALAAEEFGLPDVGQGAAEEFDLPDLDQLAREPESEWQDEPAVPSAEEFGLPDLDQLAGEPGSGWQDQPSAEEEFGLPDLDMFAAEPRADDAIAAPEDVPFPELDLDETMPGDTPKSDFFARMQQYADEPAAEEEDFVERFEPEEEVQPAPRSAPALDEEAPDWLREMAGEGLALPVDDLPVTDWEREPEEAPEEEMDWLGELSAEDVPAPEPPAEVEPFVTQPAATDALDSDALDRLLGLYTPGMEPRESLWGSEALGLPPEERPDIFEVTGAEDLPSGEPLPDLDALFGQEPFSEEAELEEPEESEEPRRRPAPETAPMFPAEPRLQERPPMTAESQPEWVEELRPSDLPVVVRSGGAETSIKQKQVVELPERLRALRESSFKDIPSTEDEPASDVGPLAGISGALPASAVMMLTRDARPTEGLVITKEQQARLNRLNALLSQVAAEEEQAEEERESFADAERMALEGILPEAAHVAKRVRRARRLKLDRVLIALLMLAALIAPFATDAVHFADDPPPLADERLGVTAAVDTVQEGGYVLFAFEYGPTAAGELDQLAAAVLRDVLARNAVPLVISTNPAGAFHAQAVFARLADDERLLAVRAAGEEKLDAGQDYVILSYLPGEAVGVRTLRTTSLDALGNLNALPAFETDLRGDETGLMIGSLERDISLIVVVGEDSGAVRTWAEQLEGVGVLKVALVGAAIEPLAVPYIQAGNYAGYLAGTRDAIRYDAERNAASREPYALPEDLAVDLPNPEEARWHSMALGTAAAAGLIALGMVMNLLRSLRRRGRR